MRARAASLAAVFALVARGALAQTPRSGTSANAPDRIQIGVEYRGRFEGPANAGFDARKDDAYWVNRFRVDARAWAAAWLAFEVQGQDAQVFGRDAKPDGPPYEDTLDLRMAFADLGRPSRRAVTARVGRQELAFGEQRLVGPSNWSNTSRTFDAVRVSLAHDWLKLDGFAASLVSVHDGEFNRSFQGESFYGVYSAIAGKVPQTTLEPYVLLKSVRNATAESGAAGHLDAVTTGARVLWKGTSGLEVNTEMAIQRGSLATDAVRAWAGHWQAVQTLRTKAAAHLTGEYNYASGNDAPKDGVRGTFEPPYPTAHDKYGLADQVGWRNIHHARAVFDVKPNPKWTLTGAYHSWWLASRTDHLYSASGILVRAPAGGAASGHVGQEIDAQTAFAATPHLQISGGYAHIVPGAFLRATTPGASYSFPFVMLTASVLTARGAR